MNNNINSITFKVKDDIQFKIPNTREFDFKILIGFNNKTTLNRYDDNNNYSVKTSIDKDSVFINTNSFIHSAIDAFNYHHKLIIRPDDIWMAILNMFSIFVNSNSELLREKFVDFNDKKKLTVNTSYNILDAPFDQLILDMKNEIKKNITDSSIADWLIPSFTTTTENDKIVYSSVLMSTLQNYFKFEFSTLCGLPEVTLLGSVEDWIDVKSRFNKVQQYDNGTNQMNQWCEILNPVLDKFIETAQGNPDKHWWNSIVKYHGESGGPFITGWLTSLLIYDNENKYIGSQREMRNSTYCGWLCVEFSQIPLGFTSVPINLKDDDGSQYNSELYAGHISVTVQDRFSIKPNIDWCLIIDRNRQIN